MEKQRPTCALLIAVLNEHDCMKITMPKVDRRYFDRIVFLDGNSTDGTQKYARENGYEVIEQGKMGLREGLIHALRVIDTDWIMTFSPDGNCPPEDIPRLIEKMQSDNFDMVIASRYREGAKSWDDTLTTKFGNFFFNLVINVLGRGHYTDCMTNFRVYKRDLIFKLGVDDENIFRPIEQFMGCPLSIEPILSFLAARHDSRIGEIPSDEPKRLLGEEKVKKWRWGIAYFLQILLVRFKPVPLALKATETE